MEFSLQEKEQVDTPPQLSFHPTDQALLGVPDIPFLLDGSALRCFTGHQQYTSPLDPAALDYATWQAERGSCSFLSSISAQQEAPAGAGCESCFLCVVGQAQCCMPCHRQGAWLIAATCPATWKLAKPCNCPALRASLPLL